MSLKTRIAAGAVSAALCALPAAAATITGEFWDATTPISTLTEADAIIAGAAPDATFDVSAIDYPSAGATVLDGTTLATFLGTDAASLSGGGGAKLGQSVFRFSGTLTLAGGDQTFAVGSDDGFRLSIGGGLVSAFDGLRPFGTTSVVTEIGAGPVPFELVYFENAGVTGIEFLIDGDVVETTDAPSVIELPPALSLSLISLGGLLLLGLRRTS